MNAATKHAVITGDSRQMGELADNSVQLIVTSPPYWQLKDYGTDSQIGFNDSYETYVNHLNLVWQECRRVLESGCRLCINIGDQFARSIYYGRYKVIPIRTEIIRFCETIGFDYMGAVIWQKATSMHTSGGATIMGSFPYPRNGILKLDYEFILIFKKPGTAVVPTLKQKQKSKLSKEEWNEYFQGHWRFAGAKQDGHIAMFPEELPKRLIKMFSFAGDTVLDPFLGSGTTSLAALNLGRNSAGYEINPEFIPMIRKRLGDGGGAQIEYQAQTQRTANFNDRIATLPYIFHDPHALDKKIDPRKMPFGSKISRAAAVKKDNLFTVREVLTPQLVTLNNDMTVRLLGIKENPTVNGAAVDFLRKKTKGQRVFMRFDDQKYDEKNNLLCYLYLQNKTFLNAHLIKAGLALPDIERNYRYKEKFIKLIS